MADGVDLAENPFELAINFVMGYSEDDKECDKVSSIHLTPLQDTYENLKEMLVSFLTMQQEVNDLKNEKEFYDEELEQLFKNNDEYISKDGNYSSTLNYSIQSS